jgi:phosphatidylserine/phosphatidylglycerophosphate/cardiolipin synthase-like enzyme
MVLSKFQWTLIGIASHILFAEFYFELVTHLRQKFNWSNDTDEINEAFFTRDKREMYLKQKTKITRQITFQREEPVYTAEIIENLIKSSKKTVHLAMYSFTLDSIFNAIKQAHDRGVKIFFVTDHSSQELKGSQISAMKKAGIETKISSKSTLMHHKFCLIDVPCKKKHKLFTNDNANDVKSDVFYNFRIPKNGLLINGSLNYTDQGVSCNYENIVVTSNASLIAKFVDEFITLWDGI